MKTMRIQHKYIRNLLAKIKARNRAKKFVGGEFSYKASYPHWNNGLIYCSTDEQIKDHQKWIDEYWVRYLIKGGKGAHAPRRYKIHIERKERRAVKNSIAKIIQNADKADDITIPTFIHQADWSWF